MGRCNRLDEPEHFAVLFIRGTETLSVKKSRHRMSGSMPS